MGIKYDLFDLYEIVLENNARLDFDIYHAEKKFEKFISKFDKTKPLGFFIDDIRNGLDISKDKYTDIDTGVYYISVTEISSGLAGNLTLKDVKKLDINESEIDVKVETNDILITRSGSPGVAWCANENFTGDQKVLVPSGYIQRIRLKEEVNISAQFLTFYLNLKPVRMLTQAYACGKDQMNLSQEYIKKIPIPIVSKNKQDKLIEINSKINKRISNLYSLLDKYKKTNMFFSLR
ncbi:MAG: restriction endonuclease subunit S, partial [Bacillota bacterium]